MVVAAIILPAVAACAICLFGDRIGEALRLIDAPDGRRKLHARATPLVGGLAVALPTAAVSFWLAASTEFLPLFATVGFVALSFLALGLADDRRHLPPSWRLVLGIAICIAALTAVPGLRVEFLRFTFIYRAFFLEGWTVFFTLLCLIGLVNALNMADGKNGLLSGLSLIWIALIVFEAPDHFRPLLYAMAAALAVVFAFNVTGKVFLGDSGSYAVGALFGLFAIHVHDARIDWLPSDRVALWFLLPVVDCLRLMARRILLGKSPFSSDRNHLHHVLYDAMPWRYGLAVYLGLAAAPSMAAAIAPKFTLLWTMMALAVYTGLLALLPRFASAERRSSNP